MANTTSNRPSIAALQRRGGFWAKRRDIAYYMLWFEFLKISPSYNMARKFRVGTLSDVEKRALPDDFDLVLSTYDDFGDIYRQLFRDWWIETGIDFFGHQGKKPQVTQLIKLRHGAVDQSEKAVSKTSTYINDVWRQQGEPAAVLMAIPVGLPKSQIVKQVFALIEKFPDEHRDHQRSAPKYQLLPRRLDSESLFKYIMCVWVKAKVPRAALWRIGVHAKVSSTYSGRLNPQAKLEPNQQIDDRNALKILTSRAISRAILISENAARGVFPSYTKHEHAVAPNWPDLAEIVKNRIRTDRR